MPKGHGLGLAVHRSFVTYVATVVEAAVDDKGNVTIPRVDVAVDCGPTVNPDRVRSQLEGAVIMGLGLAMMNELSFKDGRVQQNNFDDYQVLRISDAPRETHVHIVPHGYDMHARRGWRTRRAAGRSGPSQRRLRRDGQTHPLPAARTAIAGGLTSLEAGRGPSLPARAILGSVFLANRRLHSRCAVAYFALSCRFENKRQPIGFRD